MRQQQQYWFQMKVKPRFLRAHTQTTERMQNGICLHKIHFVSVCFVSNLIHKIKTANVCYLHIHFGNPIHGILLCTWARKINIRFGWFTFAALDTLLAREFHRLRVFYRLAIWLTRFFFQKKGKIIESKAQTHTLDTRKMRNANNFFRDDWWG